MKKQYFCERCGIIIKQRGRCLPCNYFYKHQRYYFGLKENPEYDKAQGVDPGLAKALTTTYNLTRERNKNTLLES